MTRTLPKNCVECRRCAGAGGGCTACRGRGYTYHGPRRRAGFRAVKRNPDRLRVQRPTWNYNDTKGGVEIRFPAKPADDVRESIRAAGFAWNAYDECWYISRSEAAATFASQLVARLTGQPADPTPPTEDTRASEPTPPPARASDAQRDTPQPPRPTHDPVANDQVAVERLLEMLRVA
jgi:hypothetical protein